MENSYLSRFANLDYLCWIAEGKDRLIDRLQSLDDLQKVEMKRFFRRNPSLEGRLDWNRPNSITYDSFKKLADQYPEPVDPDSVPEFSDKRDEGDGIFSYRVADTRDGQSAVRRVVDTHWGKDSNPWCIIARRGADEPTAEYQEWALGKYTPDEIMEMDPKSLMAEYARETGQEAISPDDMDNAWNSWRHYSAMPKRIAFKDGGLLAFGATDWGNERETAKLAHLLLVLHPSYKKEFMRFHAFHKLPRRGMNAQFLKWARRAHPECKWGMREEWWDRKDKPFPDLNWAKGKLANAR